MSSHTQPISPAVFIGRTYQRGRGRDRTTVRIQAAAGTVSRRLVLSVLLPKAKRDLVPIVSEQQPGMVRQRQFCLVPTTGNRGDEFVECLLRQEEPGQCDGVIARKEGLSHLCQPLRQYAVLEL